MHAIPSVLHEFALSSSGQIGPASGSASGVLAAILAVGAAVIGTVTGAHADDCPIPYGSEGWSCEPVCSVCSASPLLRWMFYYDNIQGNCTVEDTRCADHCC